MGKKKHYGPGPQSSSGRPGNPIYKILSTNSTSFKAKFKQSKPITTKIKQINFNNQKATEDLDKKLKNFLINGTSKVSKKSIDPVKSKKFPEVKQNDIETLETVLSHISKL